MSLNHPSTVDLSQELTEGFAARFIRYKAGCLARRLGLGPADWEDLEQDLKLHLVKRSSKFDPEVAHWNVFVVTVISRYILTFLMKRRCARLRDGRSCVSLDELVEDGGEVPDDPEAGMVNGCAAPCAVDTTAQRDLAIDVQESLARLPRRRRELCQRLMRDSLSEVARQMRIPRTTLYGRILALRQDLQAVAENSEKNSSDVSSAE